MHNELDLRQTAPVSGMLEEDLGDKDGSCR